MYIYISILVITYITYIIYSYIRQKLGRIPDGLKRVPQVTGKLPFIGHGIEFSRDIIGTVKKWQKEYGNIFQVKIFRTNMIIITDRNMLGDFFRAKENDMSLYKTLNRLFFGDAFTDDENFLSTIITIVKSTIRINYEEFIPKVESEANKMVDYMKKLDNQNIIISDIMMKFIARTSAQCFLCLDLSDGFYNDLMDFAHLLNKIVVLTYFLPKWFLRLFINPILRKYRNKMICQLKPLIKNYRENPELKDSIIIRSAVDYKDLVTGKGISDDQIGGILVCLLYVSTENTALGLSATITDLAINSDYWKKVRDASKKYVINSDFKSLIKSCELVDACFNESARMNTHVFPLNRYPTNNQMQLGGYYVGNVESVGICAPLLMCDDLASDLYKDPKIYKPERFMGENKESVKNLDLMSFGAFSHLCPGRQFAKLEIKIATALIVNTFESFELGKDIPPNNYFSPSAFAERNVSAKLHLITQNDEHLNDINYNERNGESNDESNDENNGESNDKHIINLEKYKIIKLQDGWLFKDYFKISEQIDIYKYLVTLSKGTIEQKELLNSDPNHAYPLTYYNLVYTNTSNCEEPVLMFIHAKKIWNMLIKYKSELGFNGNDVFEPNSLYAAMFSKTSTMSLHKDEGCDWGISISLGASAKFKYGSGELLLESGDVLIGDFSKVEHAVVKITDDVPEWFSGEYDDINTFDKTRASIQIRNVKRNQDPMTIDEFKKMIVSY